MNKQAVETSYELWIKDKAGRVSQIVDYIKDLNSLKIIRDEYATYWWIEEAKIKIVESKWLTI